LKRKTEWAPAELVLERKELGYIMSLHLERELNKLQDHLLKLCGTVENNVLKALRALQQQDETAARQVIDDDNVIDQMEVRIEEEVLKILALHQPVAIDLRRIMAVMKINNDLERIGDYAVTIAKRGLDLSGRPYYPENLNFDTIAKCVTRQLHNSVDALVRLDKNVAWQVIAEDKEIDRQNRDIVQSLSHILAADATQSAMILQLFSVTRSLERIGDHAVNIAEDVIYMITGEIVRHEHKNGRGNKSTTTTA
jgi:phosphate transport system protein